MKIQRKLLEMVSRISIPIKDLYSKSKENFLRKEE